MLRPLIACNLWQRIEEHRRNFESPVCHQMIWQKSQVTAMITDRPHTFACTLSAAGPWSSASAES